MFFFKIPFRGHFWGGFRTIFNAIELRPRPVKYVEFLLNCSAARTLQHQPALHGRRPQLDAQGRDEGAEDPAIPGMLHLVSQFLGD